MNTLIIAALCILPIKQGEQMIDAPQHIVGIQAHSTETNGTLKIESIQRYTTSEFRTWTETNVVGAVTNVTVRNGWFTTAHPVTNTVLDVTLANGKYSSVTNIYIPGGLIRATGTAFTNSIINVFTQE